MLGQKSLHRQRGLQHPSCSRVTKRKANRAMADIRGMGPRTVNKHLEHIFEKLGVETRTAAAAIATSLLQDA